MEGNWNDPCPRPRLAVAGDHVLVTDPRHGLVRQVDAGTLAETGRIEIGGQPYNLAVVGGTGARH